MSRETPPCATVSAVAFVSNSARCSHEAAPSVNAARGPENCRFPIVVPWQSEIGNPQFRVAGSPGLPGAVLRKIISAMKQARFLILRGGAIGDFIVTLPALAAIRRRWPDGYVELVGYPHIAGLAAVGGLVDRVVSLDRSEVAHYFAFEPDLAPSHVDYLRSFDVAISYLFDPSGVVCENLRNAGVRQVIYGMPVVHAGNAAEHLLKPLAELAIFPEGVEYPRLALAPDLAAQGRARLAGIGKGVIAIHPGSGSPKKNWPLRNFVDLAQRVQASGAGAPVFLTGEADHEIAGRIPALAPGVPVLSGCTLVELAAVLANCRGYVGNDSGITQLAAALGIPAVAIFGPSDPAIWAPRGPNARVIATSERSSEALGRIPVDAVWSALAAALAA